jgi:hypothetical protein
VGIVAAAGGVNTIAEFVGNLKICLEWLLHRVSTKPDCLGSDRRLANLKDILEPIAKDRNGRMTIVPITINGPVNNLSITINTLESEAAQNAIGREREALEAPVARHHEKVLLRWYQTRNDPGSTTGDKSIVESLADWPVKTIFLAESVKVRMLEMEENFFRRAFVVDLIVETIKGKPGLYKIVAIHDTVELS